MEREAGVIAAMRALRAVHVAIVEGEAPEVVQLRLTLAETSIEEANDRLERDYRGEGGN